MSLVVNDNRLESRGRKVLKMRISCVFSKSNPTSTAAVNFHGSRAI